jgi:carboxylate-amine ligase
MSEPEARFGRARFAIGVEEELLLVDPVTRRLHDDAVAVLRRAVAPAEEGVLKPDTYAAMVELTSPVSSDAPAAMRALAALRGRLRDAGATVLGAGLHPDGPFGEVEHFPAERYRLLERQLRGLVRRTPTAALHVHVGMPDADTAIRVFNALREHLPLLQALAANSPFWHGRDSGLQSARSALFRGYRGAELPRAFASYDDWAQTVQAAVAAGDLVDYTFLWWDVRLHPRLGTVEVRAMDAQGPLWSVAALAALVHGLALRAAGDETPRPPTPREALVEASFAAARDGLGARLPLEGTLRAVPDVARAAVALAAPHVPASALDGVERILREGTGADRQRAAHERGGMEAVLALLAAEAEEELAP